MATAFQAEEKLSQILQCPICLESLTRPKVLPCGDTYCASCLQSYININVTQSKATRACFPCPVCKSDTMLADHNICIERWAESLPMNNIASALIDALRRTKEGNTCGQCIKHGKKTLATYFCKDCDQPMCISCKDCHDGFPLLSRHYVTNVSDNTECFVVKPDMSTVQICTTHSGEPIKLLCVDHNILCCSLCVCLEHRKCEHVVTIVDVLKSFNVRKKSKEIKLNMVKFLDHVNTLSSLLKSKLEKLQKDKDTIIEPIQSLKSQVIAQLQELEDVIQSLEKEYKSEKSNLLAQEMKGRSLITAIKNDQIQLDLVTTNGSEVQKVILLHNLDHNQTRFTRAISEYQDEIKDVNIRLEDDEKLTKFLSTIRELGKINFIVKRVDVSSACLQIAKTPFLRQSINLPKSGHLKKRKAVKLSEFNVCTSRDQNKCNISSIVILKDNRFLVVDNANEKVKLFGQDYTCQTSIKFEESPWCACSLSATDTEVAVTIPDEMTIQIIEIDDAMRKKREIETRFKCKGIAVVNDQLVLTTNGHIILILDMHGREITAVHTKPCHSENYLYADFIKADTTNSVFYVSYDIANKLVAYSMNWDDDVLFTYTDQESTGIDVDREGNLYLCGFNTHSVLQISPEGKLIKTLISKEKERMKPLSITFYKDKDIFLLTYGHCDIVEVYELRVSQK